MPSEEVNFFSMVGQPDGVAGFGELAAQEIRQGGELIEGRPALAVEAV